MTATDRSFTDLALRLGRRNRGATAENPSVGCVIVADDGSGRRIVGRGWTQQGGRPHAEAIALERAGPAAEGATAYVSLEPCAHHGVTPPCAEALAAAGISRVVACLTDPDPRVAGAGFSLLTKLGVIVEFGPGAEQARTDLAGFLSRIERQRPFVTLKLAVSKDGKIAHEAGATAEVTGPEARARGHLIRARSDASLVGRNTVLADDPLLTCRLPGLSETSPVRVILDSTLSLPKDARLLATSNKFPVWIYGRDDAAGDRREALENAGATVMSVEACASGRPEIPALLRDLARRGINDLMVEGGGRVAASFLNADMADRIVLFRSDKIIGPNGLDALEGLDLQEITGGSRFSLTSSRPVGEDMLDWYVRKE